jgi:hypothetical protein
MAVRFGVLRQLGRWKQLDGAALGARMLERCAGVAAAKAIRVTDERRASWSRVLRRLDWPGGPFEQLPSRSLRAAKVRLFRAFKLLGALKRAAAVEPSAVTGAPLSRQP